MSKTLVFSDGESLLLSPAQQSSYSIFTFCLADTIRVNVTSQGWERVQRALAELDSMDPLSGLWQQTLTDAYCLGHGDLVKRMVAAVAPRLTPEPGHKRKVEFVRSKLEPLYE